MFCFYHRGSVNASAVAANGAQRDANGEFMQQKWQSETRRRAFVQV
jgi:hypothetical protein